MRQQQCLWQCLQQCLQQHCAMREADVEEPSLVEGRTWPVMQMGGVCRDVKGFTPRSAENRL